MNAAYTKNQAWKSEKVSHPAEGAHFDSKMFTYKPECMPSILLENACSRSSLVPRPPPQLLSLAVPKAIAKSGYTVRKKKAVEWSLGTRLLKEQLVHESLEYAHGMCL